MKKNYLNADEIKKLKFGLMSKDKKLSKNMNNSNSFSSYILNKDENNSTLSSEYYKIRNGEIGLDLEENIRNILFFDYNWKKGFINRKFNYREIIYKDQNNVIITGREIVLKIKNKNINFKLNKDKSLDIITQEESTKISNPNETFTIKYNEKIIIKEINEVEIDGIFNITNFNISIFNNQEVSIIYNNVKDEKIKNFTQAVVEIKLSKNKFKDLVEQLNNDKKIIEKITSQNILYMGFINSNKIEDNEIENVKKELNNLNCIIFGIKNSIFSGRIINKYINWPEIKKNKKIFQDIEKNITSLKKDNIELKKEIEKNNIKLKNEIKNEIEKNNIKLKNEIKKEIEKNNAEFKEIIGKQFDYIKGMINLQFDNLKK